jgi:hypothetical protein
MKVRLKKYKFIKNQEILIHAFVGLLVGYFILHPTSMVIYWFENNLNGVSFSALWSVFWNQFVESFSFSMMPMSVAFSVLGLLIGLASGLYNRSIKEKQDKLLTKRQLLNQSIPSLIADGENDFVDFKASLRHDYRQVKTDKNLENEVLKSIAGFLNAKGGTLLIGVDNYGSILGLENDYFSLKKKNKDGFQQRLILLVSNEFGKDISTKIHFSFHEIDGKEICALLVERSTRPVYLNEGGNTIFYLRTGNVTNSLTTSETVEYLQSREIT